MWVAQWNRFLVNGSDPLRIPMQQNKQIYENAKLFPWGLKSVLQEIILATTECC